MPVLLPLLWLRLHPSGTPFEIDFDIGDAIVPGQEKPPFLTQLENFKATSVNIFSIETTIVEKLNVILSLVEFSSWMKDYYHIDYLMGHFSFSFRSNRRYPGRLSLKYRLLIK